MAKLINMEVDSLDLEVPEEQHRLRTYNLSDLSLDTYVSDYFKVKSVEDLKGRFTANTLVLILESIERIQRYFKRKESHRIPIGMIQGVLIRMGLGIVENLKGLKPIEDAYNALDDLEDVDGLKFFRGNDFNLGDSRMKRKTLRMKKEDQARLSDIAKILGLHLGVLAQVCMMLAITTIKHQIISASVHNFMMDCSKRFVLWVQDRAKESVEHKKDRLAKILPQRDKQEKIPRRTWADELDTLNEFFTPKMEANYSESEESEQVAIGRHYKY
jgi:hypothetical protein